MILWVLFVLNRNGVRQCWVNSEEWCVRRAEGAEGPEFVVIRKCFLVCCERVRSISNNWVAINLCRSARGEKRQWREFRPAVAGRDQLARRALRVCHWQALWVNDRVYSFIF